MKSPEGGRLLDKVAYAMPVTPNLYTDPKFMQVQGYDFWIRATRELLKRCDAIIFTHNYHESSGARSEAEDALSLMIPRFFSVTELKAWLERQ